MIFFIMGVSGCGKSTIGQLLSEKTGIPFFDGDDFHPIANIEKMKSGQPLNDDDRRDWLTALNQLALEQSEKDGAIIACSSLKEKYRSVLQNGMDGQVKFIYLKGDFETIKKRLLERNGHFMPAGLLESQFKDLEQPSYAIQVDISQSPEMIVSAIINATERNQ